MAVAASSRRSAGPADRAPSRTWAESNNVLCVRLDSAGDVLMTTPALRCLKEARPGRKITLLTSPAGAEIARLVPVIDDVIAYDAPWVKNNLPVGGSRREYAMVRALRERRFDAAVIFCVFSQNPMPAAFLCHLADIPLRLGYCRENPYRMLTDWVPDPEPKHFIRHEVERQLDLIKSIGCTPADDSFSLHVSDRAHAAVRQLFRRLNVQERRRVVVHPGASALSRRYPPEHFAAAADAIVRNTGSAVIFTGSRAEIDLVNAVRSRMKMPSYTAAGILDLEELCALIAATDLIITNNTGPAHFAAALGTKIVDIYALTNPQHAPWKGRSRVLTHDVPCKYCYKSVCPEGHHDCLRLISPETVIAAAAELLAS